MSTFPDGSSNATTATEVRLSAPHVLERIEDIAAFLQQNAPEEPPNTGRSILQRERAHRVGKLSNPLNGEQQIFALLGYDDIRTLEGKLLTIVDASFADREQRKAFKDLVRQTIWFNWVKYLDTDQPTGGMPDRP